MNMQVKQNKRKCAWIGNGKYNKQKAAKGDPLIRVVYYKLDCSDPRGTVFVDTQEVSMANGLGIRRVLANGTFQKQERADEDDIPLAQLKSAMQLAPRWEITAPEKAVVNGIIMGGTLPAIE